MKAITISFFVFAIVFCSAKYIDHPFYLQNVGYSSPTDCYCLTLDSSINYGLILDVCGSDGQLMAQNIYSAWPEPAYDLMNTSVIEFLDIQTYDSPHVLDVADGGGAGGKDAGRQILRFPFRGGGNQFWNIVDNIDGESVTFQNGLTNGYLSVDANYKSNISQATGQVGPYQQWYISATPICFQGETSSSTAASSSTDTSSSTDASSSTDTSSST